MTNPSCVARDRRRYRVGIDVGGTFTDFVLADLDGRGLGFHK